LSCQISRPIRAQDGCCGEQTGKEGAVNECRVGYGGKTMDAGQPAKETSRNGYHIGKAYHWSKMDLNPIRVLPVF